MSVLYNAGHCLSCIQWRSEGPAGPAIAGVRGAEGPAGGPTRGPPGSSRHNPLAMGPNKLFAEGGGGGGSRNRRYTLPVVLPFQLWIFNSNSTASAI